MPRVPQLAVPFTVVDGAPLEVVQDTPAEIRQCVRAILHTPEGTMVDDPDFGIPDESFAQQSVAPDAVVYLNAVERYEPRAQLLGEAEVEAEIEHVRIRESE